MTNNIATDICSFMFEQNSSSCTESVIEIEKLKISKEAPSSVGKKQNYQVYYE